MRLLYAIDIRDEALWHLDEVDRWATRLNATVDMIYVNPVGDYAPYVVDPALSRALELELEKAKRIDTTALNKAMEHLPEAHRGEVKVVVGDAAVQISEAGQDYDAVVIATRGRKGLSRLWLGSVAEKVLRTHHGTTIVLHPDE